MRTICYKLKRGNFLEFYMVIIGCQIIHCDHYNLYLMVIHVWQPTPILMHYMHTTQSAKFLKDWQRSQCSIL